LKKVAHILETIIAQPSQAQQLHNRKVEEKILAYFRKVVTVAILTEPVFVARFPVLREFTGSFATFLSFRLSLQ